MKIQESAPFKLSPNIPILGIFFFDNFSFVIVLPIFAHLILDPSAHFISLEVSLSHKLIILGTLLASFPLAQFFGAPLLGQYADRFGKKRAFVITLSGISVGYFLSAVSLHWMNLPLLFFSRLFTGFFSVNRSICLSSLIEHYKDKTERAQNFGHLTAIEGISFTISVMVGGWFSDSAIQYDFSPSLPLWITSGLSLINLLFMLLTFTDTKKKKPTGIFSPLKGIQDIRLALSTPGVKPIALIHFFLVLSWMTMIQFNSAFLILKFRESIFWITISYAIIGILWGIFSSFFYRYCSIKWSQEKILKTGLLLLFGLMFACFFSPNFVYYICFLSLSSILTSILWPSSLLIGSLIRNKNYAGRIQGIYQSMKALALILGPLSMGYLLDENINALHLFTSIAALLGFLVFPFFLSGKEKTLQ